MTLNKEILYKSLYDCITEYPEAKKVLEGFGINLDHEEMSKKITLSMALTLKKISSEDFEQHLNKAIESSKQTADDKIKLHGVLPCPVKIPLLEAYDEWTKTSGMEDQITYKLEAASMGLDWLMDLIEGHEDADAMADVFISAGFDLFFDRKRIGRFKEKGVFKDLTGFDHFNRDFENENIQLRDPEGHYSIIATVPAVFLVNTEELKGRKVPTTWKEVLSEEFENSVSLPVGDFDLFNAILLNIYKEYGAEGVRRLGRSMMMDLHPAEMVKSHRKPERPAVTIMPYFFTKMARQGGPMQAVWPADGAIISPIFLLSKADKAEKVQPLVDFFASEEVAKVLSYNGKFPSTRPGFDNMIPANQKYMWIGWDYIKEHDISEIIETTMKLFEEGRKG